MVSCNKRQSSQLHLMKLKLTSGTKILSADNDERSRGDANAMCRNRHQACLLRQAPNQYCTSVEIVVVGLELNDM
jgi:hypothetical protein